VVVKIPLFASNFGLQTSIVQKQSAIICAICGKQISVNQWQLKNRKVSIPQMAQKKIITIKINQRDQREIK
jgi:hypothetical protein